jgi:hypothetical protein
MEQVILGGPGGSRWKWWSAETTMYHSSDDHHSMDYYDDQAVKGREVS